MFNTKFQALFVVVALSLSAVGTPVARSGVITVPVTKKVSSDIKATIAKDAVRLAGYNKVTSDAVSSPVTNQLDSYLAPVKVGTQTFNLIVDTGSSNTWVGADKKFTAGSTGKSTGKSVSVSYGSGSFSGTEYTDKVCLGAACVTSQSIGVAKTSTGFDGVDGIVGFGPVDLTSSTVSGASSVPTFMDNLLSDGVISSEVLGVSFAPLSGSSSSSQNGELTMGGTDSSKHSGSITYTPVLTSGDASAYWGVKVSSIKYSGSSIGSGSAIVDTGTTLIYIPDAAYTKFLSAAGGKTDSSTGLAKFTTKPTGTLSFTIGGTSLKLTPSQYLIPTAQYSNFGISGSGYYSWIGSGGSSGVDFIIGQKFLENYYSVFDTSNSRVGFATSTA